MQNEEALKRNLNMLKKHLSKDLKLIITTHMNPDGDALGSVLGFHNLAKYNQCQARIIIPSPIPYNLTFLDEFKLVEVYSALEHEDVILNADLICVLDLNDAKRTGEMNEVIFKSKAHVIVIDHHLEPQAFADEYIIDTDASSTGELVFKIASFFNGFHFDKYAASAIYAAILTDTGSFRFPRTDAEVHRIIAELIELGADPVMIYDEIYNKSPFSAKKLLGLTYTGMELFKDGMICIASIPDEYFKLCNAQEDDTENFVESLLSINGVKIGILLTEIVQRNEIRISLRSKREISIREIASKLGGGGHAQAAGARLHGVTLEEARASIISLLDD